MKAIVRTGIALTTAVLFVVCPAIPQEKAPGKLIMSKPELASFFSTLNTDLPRWRATVVDADPSSLNMSYGIGKFMEEDRNSFLDDCDYLQRALTLLKPSIKVQIVTLDILERMKGDVELMIVLIGLSGRTSDRIAQTGKELAAVDSRLTGHLTGLADRLDSTVDLDKLLLQ